MKRWNWLSLKAGISALAILFLASSLAHSGGIGFQNKLSQPIVVQGASVVNGMNRRGQPIVVVPGRIAWDVNLPPTQRQITIYDANQPNRVLFRQVVPFAGLDVLYSVVPNIPGSPMPVRLQLVPGNQLPK